MKRFFYWLMLKLIPHLDITKEVPKPCDKCKGSGMTVTGYCGECVGGYVGLHKVVYLRRFFIFRSKWLRKLLGKSDKNGEWGNIYLHHILRSDDDPDPHDHPWDFTSLILKSGYSDEQWQWNTRYKKREFTGYERVRPGMLVRRKAEHIHRVRLRKNSRGEEIPCWSLVRTGPYRRNWHFLKEWGFQLWWEYLGVPKPKNLADDDLETD